MAENEKMPVTVYEIDRSRFLGEDLTWIADFIIKKANEAQASKYDQETVGGTISNDYQLKLYSSYKSYQPKWRSFLGEIVAKESKLYACKNRTYSFICFIEYQEKVFAITGGLGSFAIDQYINQNFGLEVLVRLFQKDSKVIKSIQDRGVTGVIMGQTKFYRGDQRFSDENQFGKIFKQVKAELNKKILTKSFGFANADLKRETSGCMAKSSFQISKAVDFKTLLLLVKRFTTILKQKENFTLNKVILIARKELRNEKLLLDLENAMYEKLFANWKTNIVCDIDFCNKDLEKYRDACSFAIPLSKEQKIEASSISSIEDIIQLLKNYDSFYDNDVEHFKYSLLLRKLETADENGNFLTGGTVWQHIHGELRFKDKTYFLVDGEWYFIDPEFIKDLNEECTGMLKQVWEEKLINETFDLTKKESVFNLKFCGKDGWLVLDTITPENIESCDLIHSNAENLYLIHVKKGFDNSIRDLANQVSIAARRMQQDIKSSYEYINKVEQQTKKGRNSDSKHKQQLAGQKFPVGGLKELFNGRRDGNIIFCLAFVDTAVNRRVLRDHVDQFDSNIAKYALIELKREIKTRGFDFKVIQLTKA